MQWFLMRHYMGCRRSGSDFSRLGTGTRMWWTCLPRTLNPTPQQHRPQLLIGSAQSLTLSITTVTPRSYARRAVFSVREPSPTIRGVNRPIPAGYVGHPGDSASVDKARPLTTAERASIQTFPHWFSFCASRTNTEQMIGNAVPPKLAFWVARAAANALCGE